MALPKIDVPTYELTLPSEDKVVQYRPFLVKEEKLLMIAMESKEDKQVQQAVIDLVNFNLLIPTSIMIEFGFTYDSSTISGLPIAVINISALLQWSLRFFVLECVTVTEQLADNNNEAIGLPTIFDLPIITAFLPLSWFNSFFKI